MGGINWKIATGAIVSILGAFLYLLRSRFKQGQAVGQADRKLRDETARIAGMSNTEVADDLSKKAERK